MITFEKEDNIQNLFPSSQPKKKESSYLFIYLTSQNPR